MATHLPTVGDKTYNKGRNAVDATKNLQSVKAVALQDTRHGELIPIATNVKTNLTFVSPASETNMKMYEALTS